MTKRIPAASRTRTAPKMIQSNQTTKSQLSAMVKNMLYGAGLDVPDKILNRQKKNDLLKIVNNVSSLVSRSALQSALGQSFYGKRDLYDVLGWKKELLFEDYLWMYKRNGIAKRVVNFKASECWRKFPVLHDGKTEKDYQDNTPFLKAWLEMVDTLQLQSIFNKLDIALGISRYSVIVIGVEGDTKYNEPLNERGNKNIKFLRVLDEGQAAMVRPVTDIYSPRYGLPEIYNCKFEEEGVAIPVHWTRIVHFKHGGGRSSVFGSPGLEGSFNFLEDLVKVDGSSSEAFWQHIRRVIVLSAKEGFDLPTKGTPEYTSMQDEVEEYEHNMRLVLRLRNMDITQITSQVIDGRNQHDLLIADIAGTEGISQRILIGSEAAHLASTQDVLNTNNMISGRQKSDCTPWLRQFVQYLYTYQFLPPPTSGKFQIEWLSLYEMNPMEKVELGIKKAEFLEKVTGGNLERGMLVEDLVYETLDGYVIPPADEPITDETEEVDKADTTDTEKEDETDSDKQEST